MGNIAIASFMCVCATRIHQNECATSLVWPIDRPTDRPPAQPLYLVQTTKTICFCSAIFCCCFLWISSGDAMHDLGYQWNLEMKCIWWCFESVTRMPLTELITQLWMSYERDIKNEMRLSTRRLAPTRFHFEEREKNKTHNKRGDIQMCALWWFGAVFTTLLTQKN